MKNHNILRKTLNLAFYGLLLVFLLAVPAGGVTLRLLHINDFHGFAEPHKPLKASEPLGGMAYLAGEAARLRQGQPTLLLAAGDMIQGNNWANLFQGKSSIELMNAMKFDAMVVGNHEFDYGQEVLKARLQEAGFPLLGANVQGLPGLKPYVLKDLQGLRVAVIGVTTPDTYTSTHPRNVTGLKFTSPETAVAECLKELQGKADLVVVLSHLGYSEDRALAQKIPGIGVIVGGHTHTRLEAPALVNRTVIVQAWEHGKALGVLDLEVEDGKIVKYAGRQEEIKPRPGRADKAIEAIVRKYSQEVDARLDQTVGETKTDLNGENVRLRETNLGNLVTDVMREVTEAEAAIINGGTIRTSIRRGPVKAKDIYAALPFDNYLVALRLSGAQVREALEHGVSCPEEKAGRFPQVSGLSFTYNPKAAAGARVREVTINGRPLESGKEYVVATHDFLAAGGDGYRSFGEGLKCGEGYREQGGALTSKNLAYCHPGVWLRDLVIEYLKNKKTIAPQTEGRIKAVD
jgi:2',3'-cyclic-nucleotide 2'-phosphodiesterase (5'-nucleotidase family)